MATIFGVSFVITPIINPLYLGGLNTTVWPTWRETPKISLILLLVWLRARESNPLPTRLMRPVSNLQNPRLSRSMFHQHT